MISEKQKIHSIISELSSLKSRNHSDDNFFLNERSQFRLEKGLELIEQNAKDALSDLDSLLIWIFEETISPLYVKYLPISSPNISVCVFVYPDGLGDFGSALKTIHCIKKNFQHPTISLFANICNFSGSRKKTIESSIPPNLARCILAEKFNEPQKKEVQETLQKSDLIVQPAWDNTINEDSDQSSQTLGISIDALPFLSFTEYGCDSYDLGLNTGIGHTRMGIFLFDEILLQPFSNIQFAPLKEMLSPFEHSPQHVFFFGYMKELQDFSLAFISLCCLVSKSHQDLIDIVISSKAPVQEDLNDQSHFFIPLLIAAKVKEISFFSKSNDGLCLAEIFTISSLLPEGKSVRVINPFPLQVEDFDLLIRKSALLTASTGDLSFSKSLPTLPFYQILDHKEDFYESILEHVCTHFGQNSPICNYFYYFKALHESIRYCSDLETTEFLFDLAELIASPELHQQFAAFYSDIKKFQNLEDSIISRMGRKMLNYKYPNLLDMENDFIEHYPKNISHFESYASTLAQVLQKTAKDSATLAALVEES